ncbi:MAG TPA: phenylalanine--tRNA ligase subunit alpha, partial [Gammaproteobacteria bacterium]|nr:phenylalanine--tRNA ligase subunit alpha [Gammaproteobacteria bacterium]
MVAESDSDLIELVSTATTLIGNADSLAELDEVRVRYLGKSGLLTAQLKQLGRLPKEERPQAGEAINRAKQSLQTRIEQQRTVLQRQVLSRRLNSERVDVTLPGRGMGRGGLHPVTRTLERIE